MHEHLLFMAEHVVKKLNELGIIKDAQVNITVKRATAGFMNDYMNQRDNELDLVLRKEHAAMKKTIADSDDMLTRIMKEIGDVNGIEEALEAIKTMRDMADAANAAEEARQAERAAGWDPNP